MAACFVQALEPLASMMLPNIQRQQGLALHCVSQRCTSTCPEPGMPQHASHLQSPLTICITDLCKALVGVKRAADVRVNLKRPSAVGALNLGLLSSRLDAQQPARPVCVRVRLCT